MDKKYLTTSQGIPVGTDLSSMTTGEKEGYTLLQDFHLVEKLAHFNRERIPERIVHAKGTGAKGYFEVTNDLSKYTKAKLFSEVGKKTDVFLRFSTVGGERGSADTARDPRGFAIRFYTEEGNYDIVGNNTPVFFIRDALKFPDLIHTQKRNPQTNLHDADMFWDFFSLTPESIHQVTILFSDRGTPYSHRHMDGHSSHTFMWYNEKNEFVWVKYHFKTNQGIKTMTNEEAQKMAGVNPDHSTEDLFNAIKNKEYPSWDVFVQIMTPEEAKTYKFDPFDVTKVWYHSDYPLIPLGRLTLNQNPDNFFADVEQAAFTPANLVPGIAASPDKLLQGRLFAYGDAHRYRLGANSHQIPVNKPRCPFSNGQRDGAMSVDGNSGAEYHYFPSSLTNTITDTKFNPPFIDISASLGMHDRPLEDVDFIQAGVLFDRVMNDSEKANTVSNIAGHLGDAKENIQYRQTALFYKASADYGTKVANASKLDVEKVKKLASLTQQERVEATK